jgi:hypothetical protein
MRWLTIAAALAALALGLAAAGCGGGDDEASDEPDATLTETETDTDATDETTTEEETTTDESTDTSGSDATGFDFDSEECRNLLNVGAAFSAAISSATGGTDLTDEAEAFENLAEDVPDEIKSDVAVLAGVYAKYADAFKDIDIQPGETPSAADVAKLTAAFSAIDTEEASQASERIGTWAQENCTTG